MQDFGHLGNAMDRRSQLAELGLSPALLDLASERWPHRAFEFPCGHVYRCYAVPDEYWPEGFIPLWECTEEVVGIRKTPTGSEFLAWDLESPDSPERLARSEQGLFLWLFSYLIEYEEWENEVAAMERLRAAAAAVGFRYFDRIYEFACRHGQELNYRESVRAEAWAISGDQSV
jgi:hypothetical protein